MFKKKTLFYIIVFFGSALFLFFWQRYHVQTTILKIGDERIDVMVAYNIHQQYRGLGGRDSLAPYDGMLFPFGLLGKHAIVMRDMRFSIDILWLKQGEIVDIASSVVPEPDRDEAHLTRYYPRRVADMVLELPAGWTSMHSVKIGDRVLLVE